MKKIESARGKHYLSMARRIHYTLDKNSMDMADITESYLLHSSDKSIEIKRGYAGGSYYLIAPAKIRNYEDTENEQNTDILMNLAVSVDEYDVEKYLYPVLLRHFESDLPANANRACAVWTPGETVRRNGQHYMKDFDYHGSNYYSFDSIFEVIEDLDDISMSLARRTDEHTEDEIKMITGFYDRLIAVLLNMIDSSLDKGYDHIIIQGL